MIGKKTLEIKCEAAALVSLDELVELQGELKSLSKKNYRRLKKEILETGIGFPFKVWRHQSKMYLVGGHQTYRTLKQMRDKEKYDVPRIPVSWIHARDIKEAKRRVLQDISQYGKVEQQGLYEFIHEPNANIKIEDLVEQFDIPEVDLEEFQKEYVNEPVEVVCDEDEVPEQVESVTRLGDTYLLGKHRLLCGDSTSIVEVAKLMDGEKADMVFTSPPYADLRDYGGNLDMDPKTLSKVFDWPADIIVINLGLIIRDREIVTYWDDYLYEAKIRGLKLLSWNIWNKGNASAPAHQQAMFGLCHEWIFVFGEYRQLNLTKPNKLFGENSVSTIREKDGSLSQKTSQKIRSHRQLDTIIDMVPVKHNLTGHPATFPVDLPLEYINAVTTEDEIVCEPFGGSGSTLIACEKTNRRCFMMEIDPHYCDVIIARWEKYTGQKAKLLSRMVYPENKKLKKKKLNIKKLNKRKLEKMKNES